MKMNISMLLADTRPVLPMMVRSKLPCSVANPVLSTYLAQTGSHEGEGVNMDPFRTPHEQTAEA